MKWHQVRLRTLLASILVLPLLMAWSLREDPDVTRRKEISRLGGYVEGHPMATGILFHGEQAEQKHFEILSHFQSIHDLTFRRAILSENSVKLLPHLDRLTIVDFVDCSLPSNFSEALSKLNRLEILRINNAILDHNSLNSLGNCTSLTQLEMSGVDLPQGTLESIATLQNLKRLYIQCSSKPSHEQIDSLKKQLPHTTIEIDGGFPPTPEDIP